MEAVIEVTDDDGEIVLEFPFTEALLDMPDQSATGTEAPRSPRHCEEPLRRSNPDCLRGDSGLLRCARNDGAFSLRNPHGFAAFPALKDAGHTEQTMQDLWRLSAADLATLVKSKKVSAREAAKAGLGRLDAVNPKLNAVIDHRPEDVLKQADAVDAAIARGEDPGVLAGVPVTIKANVDQEGFATTNGLKLQRDLIAREDNPVVANFRKAGAVLLGRTNCPAFSYRWFTTNLVHGDTKNPRDASLTPGGSSGGAGSAVAAGIGHIAHGTDIAGSIRYPAYACGVHGLRPTLGRIPAFNPALPERPIGPQIMAVSGPLARTVNDLRISLAAMSARDARDPWFVPAPLEGPAVPKRAALCLNPGRPCDHAGGEGRRDRRRQAAGACRLDRRGDREHAADARSRRVAAANSGSATATRRSWRWPSAKAIPARWRACAATAPRSRRWTRPTTPRR